MVNTVPNQPNRRRVSTSRLNHEDSQLVALLEVESDPTPTGKTPPHPYPKIRFRGERARDMLLFLPCALNIFVAIANRSRVGKFSYYRELRALAS